MPSQIRSIFTSLIVLSSLFCNFSDSKLADGEDLYESIYEVVNPPGGNSGSRDYDDDEEDSEDLEILDSEDEFDEIIEEDEDCHRKTSASNPNFKPGLSKFAEAAGKKMKKLRRNWSLKKADIITRSLSRIRKNSQQAAAAAAGGSGANVGPALPPGGPGGIGGKKAGIANVGRAPSFKGRCTL